MKFNDIKVGDILTLIDNNMPFQSRGFAEERGFYVGQQYTVERVTSGNSSHGRIHKVYINSGIYFHNYFFYPEHFSRYQPYKVEDWNID